MKPVGRRWQLSGGVTGALAVILFLSLTGSVDAQIVPGNAEIKAVTGRVEILRRGQPQWVAASVGAKLGEGDEVRTSPGSSAELVLPDTSSILVAENTRFAVTKIAIDRQNQSRMAIFHLSVGKVRAALAQSALQLVQARQSNFAISTPTGVAATRGTIFVVAYQPATRTTVVAVLRGQAIFADFTTRTPVVVGVNNVVTQVGTAPPSRPVPIATLPAPVRAQLPTPSNPATAGQPALTAPPAPPPATSQVAAVVVTAAVQVAPAQAPAVTAGAVAAAPEAAAEITSAAVAAAPSLAPAITSAAVAAAPTLAPVIVSAAVSAAPAQAQSITAAAISAAPAQAAAITTAAAAAAAAAPPPPPPAVAALVAPPPTPVPIATVAQDVTVTQQCASPPCP